MKLLNEGATDIRDGFISRIGLLPRELGIDGVRLVREIVGGAASM